jgi:hypothetical protein
MSLKEMARQILERNREENSLVPDPMRDTPETPGGKPIDLELAALIARLEALPDGGWLHNPADCPDCLEKLSGHPTRGEGRTGLKTQNSVQNGGRNV